MSNESGKRKEKSFGTYLPGENPAFSQSNIFFKVKLSGAAFELRCHSLLTCSVSVTTLTHQKESIPEIEELKPSRQNQVPVGYSHLQICTETKMETSVHHSNHISQETVVIYVTSRTEALLSGIFGEIKSELVEVLELPAIF